MPLFINSLNKIVYLWYCCRSKLISFYFDSMSQEINENDNEDGDHQDTDDNSNPIATHLQLIQLQGKLMDLFVTELVQSCLNLIGGESQLGEPFTDHFRFQDFLDLLKVGGSVNG